MTLKHDIKILRKAIGERDDHHNNCSRRKGGACDCYAKRRESCHLALDNIVQAVAAEREACAEIADAAVQANLGGLDKLDTSPEAIAAAIRARG